MSNGHAFLSASGSKIWLACTPSARAQEPYPDTESVFSREGTFAHGLATARLEIKLKRDKDALNKFQAANKEAWAEFRTQELTDYVEGYVERCMALIDEVRAKCPDAIVMLEQRLDFSRWVPEGFGTGDLVIVADRVLYVRDLKFGKGVWVDAENNSQMRLYAGGALDTYGMLYDFDVIDVGIEQPRLDNFDQERLTREELTAWLDDYVAPRAALAWNGEGEFVAGDHCTFCRARHDCAKRAEHNLAAVSAYSPEDDFKTLAPAMSEEQIAEILPKLDEFIRWAKDLKDWSLREQVFGRKKFPGLKLVAGRSVRKITDIEALVLRLIDANVDARLLYQPPELLGLTALEKLVGKKKFGEIAGAQLDAMGDEEAPSLLKKPPGKPKLVPAGDKRPEWVPENAADIDFGNLEDE